MSSWFYYCCCRVEPTLDQKHFLTQALAFAICRLIKRFIKSISYDGERFCPAHHQNRNEPRRLLREGRPIALIADEVGYESSSALARAFQRMTGTSPREWLQSQTPLRVQHAAAVAVG